jgi:hypothetical protein
MYDADTQFQCSQIRVRNEDVKSNRGPLLQGFSVTVMQTHMDARYFAPNRYHVFDRSRLQERSALRRS